ncbi:MAG: hypothetical protein CSA68_00440 [Rhodobacterales bacterium]|nr:MAG: hypothetical protein CSA68_00440 [Rhodobacterales bacterium]
MLKRLTLATATALALSTAGLSAAEYNIDHTHSFVQFKVSHLGVSYVIGNFDVTKGSFTFDGQGSPADQSITIEVSTASLGELTLFGTTKPIEVMVKKIGEGKDPWGGYRAGFEGKVVITPADFGATYNLGPAAKTVELNIIIEGKRK